VEETREIIVCKEHGFSLIELLVGAIIAFLVAAAAFTMLTTSSKATRVSDQTAQTQQSARIAMELLSHDIKMAGFAMAGPVGNCNQAIVPADNNVGGADNGPDSISLVVPAQVGTVNTTTSMWPIQSIDVNLTSAVNVGDPISIGGMASTTVSVVSGTTLTLQNSYPKPMTFTAGTPVYLLQCVTYQVIRPTDVNASVCGGNAPCLVRGINAPLVGGRMDCNGPGGTTACVAITDGVEDVQFSYACDGCNAAINAGVADGIIDDQGVVDNQFTLADFVSDNSWTVAPMTGDTIRLVLVNVVARETRPDQGFGEGNATMTTNSPSPITVSDHNPALDSGYSLATYQQYRRRIVTRTVEVRNIGL